ncbi:DUF551 domain-containing protein [Alkaliphilus sp. B6464]|uniref:DUF551 domain-containing protein n=1 Tax=Alkaliphilus sp. B6464 TaxID=2731219 RepID=UPI001BAD8A4D|nr:DUF551 domain-containing protein [Alkaliphilus sp. B6464]QUH22184.1 DUF551 domain-containing protein [Alkaliphilus sp. B6464]
MEINKLWEMYEESITKEVQLKKKDEIEKSPFVAIESCTQNGISNGILQCLKELEKDKGKVFRKAYHLYCKAQGINANTGFGFWIPVKERLPEQDTNVIACFDDGFITGVEYTNDWELWADSGEVVAWMPLPEPYKEK